MRISKREPIVAFDFRQIRNLLLELRMKRNNVIYKMRDLRDGISSANTEEAYDKLNIDLKSLEDSYLDFVRQIKQNEMMEDLSPERAQRRVVEEREIKEFGFSLVEHADERYNERFLPYMTRSQLFEFLKNLNLKDKIRDEAHEIIKLKPNFWVAVEDFKVITFRFDKKYYDEFNGNPPKIDLKLW